MRLFLGTWFTTEGGFVHLSKDDGHEPLDDELPLLRVGDLMRADGEQVLMLGGLLVVRVHIICIIMRRIK